MNNAIKDETDFTKNSVVIGGCGTAASLIARVLKQQGHNVTVSDLVKDTPLKDVFNREGINLDLGQHSPEVLANADTIVLAPSLKNNKKVLDLISKNSNAKIISIDEILDLFKVSKPVIGITGTNGKTTTTTITKNILKLSGLEIPEHYLNIQGNTEYIPAMQARLKGDVAVVEIGTFGKPNEIYESAKNSNVSIGIITNITQDHLENGHDFNKYISCKKEMLNVADNIVLNADDPYVSNFANEVKHNNIIFFGIENILLDSDSFAEERICPFCSKKLDYKQHYLGHMGQYTCSCSFKRPEPNVKAYDVTNNLFRLVIGSDESKVKLNKPGICNVYNALAATSAALALGVDFEYIVKGIESFKGVPGRFQEINDNPKIIMDFAHNPAGVKASLQAISCEKKGRLIVINTIASESGETGDRDIANILNNVDIIIPASHAARVASEVITKEVILTKASEEKTIKTGTLGATEKQILEGLQKAVNIYKKDDIILIIGEGGFKYAKKVLSKSIN